MPNANTKKVIFILITFALFFIASCSSPEKKREHTLARVAQLQASGDYIAALELLETLSQHHPDDSEILQRIGLIHQKSGNPSEAAFYLGAAHNLAPENLELLYQAYLAHEDANQPETGLNLLEAFATSNPTGMTNALWFRLGELRVQAKKTESALEAYLEGMKLTNEKPSVETALAIGTLFKQLNNLPMAQRWLAFAARSNDTNALPALFGLLEIHLRNKNWEAAEKAIVVIDEKFPGAVDASEWANIRNELKKWRTAQTEMNAQLGTAASAEKKAQELTQTEKTKPAQPADRPTTPVKTSPVTTSSTRSGKEQITTDIANAEALANKPAKEAPLNEPSIATATTEETKSTESEITYNPSILIQPAEPVENFDEETKPDNQENTVLFGSLENYQSSANQAQPLTEPDITPDVKISEINEPALPDTTLLSLEELIDNAEKATSKRSYEQAIQLYWDALGRTNQRADIWNALSKVYLIDGQAKNAATTALEATRLEPKNIQYILDYLRVVQRVKKPSDFIRELETAYDRFPHSPEITLSLARGYRRVGGNDYAADILYRRFIQMAPKHPLRPEAEAALSRIR